MLLGKDVDKIIAYAKSKGLACNLISNAFWATDYDKAYRTLKRLKGKGLVSISFSTGEDHNKYVPWMNVRHAAVAAARLGLATDLRIENQIMGQMTVSRGLYSDVEVMELVAQKKLVLTTSPWMEYANKGKKSRAHKVVLRNDDKKESCHSLFDFLVGNSVQVGERHGGYAVFYIDADGYAKPYPTDALGQYPSGTHQAHL